MAIFQRLNRSRGHGDLVTHELNVPAYASRVIHFRDGRIVKDERVASPRDAVRKWPPGLTRVPGRGSGSPRRSLDDVCLASIRIALRALRVNKLRSALTMLAS